MIVILPWGPGWGSLPFPPEVLTGKPKGCVLFLCPLCPCLQSYVGGILHVWTGEVLAGGLDVCCLQLEDVV